MSILLAIKTDQQLAELKLIKNQETIHALVWEAHRKLSDTIHHKISELLEKNHITLGDIDGLVVFEGPGSFTGLRIGFSVANALSYSLQVPVVCSAGIDWVEEGVKALPSIDSPKTVIPVYGSAPIITNPKK